jgi:hypothetical protein
MHRRAQTSARRPCLPRGRSRRHRFRQPPASCRTERPVGELQGCRRLLHTSNISAAHIDLRHIVAASGDALRNTAEVDLHIACSDIEKLDLITSGLRVLHQVEGVFARKRRLDSKALAITQKITRPRDDDSPCSDRANVRLCEVRIDDVNAAEHLEAGSRKRTLPSPIGARDDRQDGRRQRAAGSRPLIAAMRRFSRHASTRAAWARRRTSSLHVIGCIFVSQNPQTAHSVAAGAHRTTNKQAVLAPLMPIVPVALGRPRRGPS